MAETKIYVTGSRGLVASKFVEKTSKNFKLITPEIDELDITDYEALLRYFDKENLSGIINFAAMTNVDEAERQRKDGKSGNAWKVNVEGTINLARLAKEKRAFFVQISTDFIFPGTKDDPGPYTEDSKVSVNSDSISWYGWTKKLAEDELSKMGIDYAIVRLAFPTGNFVSPRDYLNKIFSGIQKEYPMFIDQFVTPTWIQDMVKVIEAIVDNKMKGVFHVATHPITTPYKIASLISEKLELGEVKKGVISSYLKNQFAPRPLFGGLDCSKTQKLLGMTFLTWQEAVNEFVRKRKILV